MSGIVCIRPGSRGVDILGSPQNCHDWKNVKSERDGDTMFGYDEVVDTTYSV